MKTAYFTFGQDHVHRVNGKTIDCDCVVKISSEEPRDKMFELFGPKWSMQYDEMPQDKLNRFYPRGIIEL